MAARELLTESGSIFVQIGDENGHLVRCLLDEVFGIENFVSLITCSKTTGTTGHIADFQQYLADKQNSDKHVELICSRVGKLIDDWSESRGSVRGARRGQNVSGSFGTWRTARRQRSGRKRPGRRAGRRP
ncbi:MAG: hypothetical protein MUE50_01410 [Pirellulaceae bacterium]|nr:hypothetical protein [Pirellulaceae bacterium]